MHSTFLGHFLGSPVCSCRSSHVSHSFLVPARHYNFSRVVVAFLSDRLKWRGPFILIFLPLAIIGEFSGFTFFKSKWITGYIVAITASTNGGRYVAVFLMAAGV